MRLNIPRVLAEDKILELQVHVSTFMVETSYTTHSQESKQKKTHIKWCIELLSVMLEDMFIKSMDKYVTTIIISFIERTLSQGFCYVLVRTALQLAKYP